MVIRLFFRKNKICFQFYFIFQQMQILYFTIYITKASKTHHRKKSFSFLFLSNFFPQQNLYFGFFHLLQDYELSDPHQKEKKYDFIFI